MLKCTDVGGGLHYPTAFIMPRPHGVGHYATMSVRLSVLHMPDPKSRTEGRSKVKIDRREAHHTGDP